MSQNNVPLDRSSDKSSDSGGLLDLSSRALSDGDETWLFTMEAMKDMKLIEEEEFPDDLLGLSQGSLCDVDEDSLDQLHVPEAANPSTTTEQPPLLLDDIETDTKNTCIISPSPKMQNSPSAHVAPANDPSLTTPSCCSETTDDAQTLMDDFGFNINVHVAAPHVNGDSPCLLMDEKKGEEERRVEGETPSDLGPLPLQPATTDAPQSLLDDFGFDIDVGAPHTDSDSPCILMDEKEEKEREEEEDAPSDLVPSPVEPTSTITEAPQSLLDDFGFNIRLSSPHKGRSLPNTVHRRGNKSSEVSPSSELKTKYLMRFDTDLSSTHSKKKPTAANWSPTKAQILMEFDSNLTLSDVEKDTCTASSTGKAASTSLDNTLASPRLIEKDGDGQDDFEFKVDVTNPPLVGASTAEQGSDDAQNLLDDFGFESNMCTSATPMMEDGVVLPIASMTDSVNEPLIVPPSVDDVNANSQTLLDDFGFDINVSALHISRSVSDIPTTDSCCALIPSSNDTPSKVVPLIAFSSDTVRLWEAKQKEAKSHTANMRRRRSQSPPSIDTADSDQTQQTPSEAHTCSSEKLQDPIDNSVDRTAISEKAELVDGGSGSVGEREKVDDGDNGGELGKREESLQLPTPSEQLAECSPILASPVKINPVDEFVVQRNTTFTMDDGTSPSNCGETAVQPGSSASIPTIEKSNDCSSADGPGEETPKVDPQSLNSSVSSEHSQASSICSSVSVASAKEYRETGRTTSTAVAGRKMTGKIPKPVSKNRPNIKPSLLPSKSASTLPKASGALASCKLQPPSSRLMKPKSISNPSTRNGLSKSLGAGLKQPTSRLTITTTINRGSKLAKPSNADTATTLRQPTIQRGAGQPRLMMAAPSAALRKKKVVAGGATENPMMVRRQPFTASTPISSSTESGGGGSVSGSPRADSRANDTFTIDSSSTASSTTSISPPTAAITAAKNTDAEMTTGSTPKTSKQGRRSFIPTPSQDKKVKRTRDAAGGGGTGIGMGGVVPSGVFKPRNGPSQTNGYLLGYRPVKSKIVPVGGSKVVHSPLDKENRPATPHSKWSPIRRKKPLNFEEACIQCTKKVK